jgi:hypothetical protein
VQLGLYVLSSLRLVFYQTYAQTYGTFHISTSWAWRVPSTFQGLVPVIQVCLIFFVPESPRWLVSKGRYVIGFVLVSFITFGQWANALFREAQALKTLAYYHSNGNE